MREIGIKLETIDEAMVALGLTYGCVKEGVGVMLLIPCSAYKRFAAKLSEREIGREAADLDVMLFFFFLGRREVSCIAVNLVIF